MIFSLGSMQGETALAKNIAYQNDMSMYSVFNIQ